MQISLYQFIVHLRCMTNEREKICENFWPWFLWQKLHWGLENDNLLIYLHRVIVMSELFKICFPPPPPHTFLALSWHDQLDNNVKLICCIFVLVQQSTQMQLKIMRPVMVRSLYKSHRNLTHLLHLCQDMLWLQAHNRTMLKVHLHHLQFQ